jgi:beta-1,3-galactosyltransferase 1
MTIIGELHYVPTWDLAFSNGGLYTVTWDMVELLVSLQEKFHVVTGEDMAVSILMQKGREVVHFVNLIHLHFSK